LGEANNLVLTLSCAGPVSFLLFFGGLGDRLGAQAQLAVGVHARAKLVGRRIHGQPDDI